jgi:dihydrofolate synthase / folylpolyglutamate synthase
VLGYQPLVLLDGAHNVAGAHTLRSALEEEFPSAPRTFVVGLLREKDAGEMLEALGASNAARIICCRPPSPRAQPPDDLAAAAIDLGVDPDRVEVVEDVTDALERAREVTAADEQIVVTGTLYLVGAARGSIVRSTA